MSKSKQRLLTTGVSHNAPSASDEFAVAPIGRSALVRQPTDERLPDGDEAARNDPSKSRSGLRISPWLAGVDYAILTSLFENARMSVREIASQVGLAPTSTAQRIRKLEDCGAITGYTILTDPRAFGLAITAHVTLRAMPGEAARVTQMLVDTHEVVEADRIEDSDCFVVKVVTEDVDTLTTAMDRFSPYCSTDTEIVFSSAVTRRLPRLSVSTKVQRQTVQ